MTSTHTIGLKRTVAGDCPRGLGVVAILVAGLAALAAPCATAGTLDEDVAGLAGPLPTSALAARGAGTLSTIRGRLSSPSTPSGSTDLYLIRISDVAAFSARTVVRPGELPIGTQLWLFDACGSGVLGNDNTPNGRVGSQFSLLLPAATDASGAVVPGPGLYYLGVTGRSGNGTGRIPVSAGGPIFQFANQIEISGPDGPGGAIALSGWSGSGPVGAYQVELTGVEFLGAGFANLDGANGVDGVDLGILLQAWGTSDALSDLNADGTVDGADLGFLLGAWGPSAGPHFCGDAGSGDCFSNDGTRFCDDVCCCTQICAVDPNCCTIAWDELCASVAVALCE